MGDLNWSCISLLRRALLELQIAECYFQCSMESNDISEEDNVQIELQQQQSGIQRGNTLVSRGGRDTSLDSSIALSEMEKHVLRGLKLLQVPGSLQLPGATSASESSSHSHQHVQPFAALLCCWCQPVLQAEGSAAHQARLTRIASMAARGGAQNGGTVNLSRGEFSALEAEAVAALLTVPLQSASTALFAGHVSGPESGDVSNSGQQHYWSSQRIQGIIEYALATTEAVAEKCTDSGACAALLQVQTMCEELLEDLEYAAHTCV
eukprot:jgi/Chrzof1/10073/Cz04g26040.t1